MSWFSRKTLCPHRGHEITNGRCPYHGLPHPVPEGCFTKAQKECQLPDRLKDEMAEDRGELFQVVEQKIKAPPELWFQNTMDFRHLSLVHPEFAKQFSGVPYDVRIGPKESSHKLLVKPAIRRRYEDILDCSLMPYFAHVLIYPDISLTTFLGVFYSTEYVSDVSGKIVTQFFLSKSKPFPKVGLDAVRRANEQILAEDKAIVESWARTVNHTGNWLPGEERIKAYVESL